jgi:folylpolyglutamate synthase/dihydropteroate synthase
MNNDYASALQWLNKLSSESAFFKKKAQPSLDLVHKALDLMGRPDKNFKYRVVVGGTAGKGTVCRHIEQTLLQEGTSVALLSSPHLQVVNERIRINGKIISKDNFTVAINKIKGLVEIEKLSLTYYEVIVLAGIYWAANQGIKILVCEVGLGGEFDAVNAVSGPRICGLTFIGDDHIEILGPTRENIAQTKSKIFTQDSIGNFSYEQKFRTILDNNASAKITYLKGIKQKLNKKLARKIIEQILGTKSFIMPSIHLPCRWEKISPKVRLDGAHSVSRFEFLEATKLLKNKGPYTLILGMQKRHDIESFKSLIPYAKNIIWTESGEADCCSAEALQKNYGVGEIESQPLQALLKAQHYDENILVTGSLYLCGAIREAYFSSASILDQQTEWPVLD